MLFRSLYNLKFFPGQSPATATPPAAPPDWLAQNPGSNTSQPMSNPNPQKGQAQVATENWLDSPLLPSLRKKADAWAKRADEEYAKNPSLLNGADSLVSHISRTPAAAWDGLTSPLGVGMLAATAALGPAGRMAFGVPSILAGGYDTARDTARVIANPSLATVGDAIGSGLVTWAGTKGAPEAKEAITSTAKLGYDKVANKLSSYKGRLNENLSSFNGSKGGFDAIGEFADKKTATPPTPKRQKVTAPPPGPPQSRIEQAVEAFKNNKPTDEMSKADEKGAFVEAARAASDDARRKSAQSSLESQKAREIEMSSRLASNVKRQQDLEEAFAPKLLEAPLEPTPRFVGTETGQVVDTSNPRQPAPLQISGPVHEVSTVKPQPDSSGYVKNNQKGLPEAGDHLKNRTRFIGTEAGQTADLSKTPVAPMSVEYIGPKLLEAPPIIENPAQDPPVNFGFFGPDEVAHLKDKPDFVAGDTGITDMRSPTPISEQPATTETRPAEAAKPARRARVARVVKSTEETSKKAPVTENPPVTNESKAQNAPPTQQPIGGQTAPPPIQRTQGRTGQSRSRQTPPPPTPKPRLAEASKGRALTSNGGDSYIIKDASGKRLGSVQLTEDGKGDRYEIRSGGSTKTVDVDPKGDVPKQLLEHVNRYLD